jgi:periplasmic protein TonB
MVLFWALIISIILHFIFFMSVNSGDSKHEQSQQTFIEISLITKSAPIKSKKNDGVVTKSHLLATEVQPPHSEASITQIIKEVSVKNIGNTAKIPMFQKKEKPVVEKVEIEEKPRLSLESIQQQISQIGDNSSQQQVNVRDKYINDFGVKVKRIGQTIYDRGVLPAGILETKIEINTDGLLVNFKITRSSGSAQLDKAVENMIRSSAPYPDLPFQLLNESNTLSFTRIWEFYGD